MRCCDCEYRIICDPLENHTMAFASCGTRDTLKGIPIIKEWVKAQREKRLMILPVPLGTPIFRIYNTKGCSNCEYRTSSCSGNRCPAPRIREQKFSYEHLSIMEDAEFSCEEAEAALAAAEKQNIT